MQYTQIQKVRTPHSNPLYFWCIKASLFPLANKSLDKHHEWFTELNVYTVLQTDFLWGIYISKFELFVPTLESRVNINDFKIIRWGQNFTDCHLNSEGNWGTV